MPVAPSTKAESAPAGLSTRSLSLWLAAAQYRRRADELAARESQAAR
jgi:hypothetical protein